MKTTKEQLDDIVVEATLIAQDRLSLIARVRKLVEADASLQHELRVIDGNFKYKLFGHAGDITAHRIAKVFDKVRKVISEEL